MYARFARLALAIVLIASAVILSLSSLSFPGTLAAWGAVGLGTILALAARWLDRRGRSPVVQNSTRPRPDALDLALLAQIAAATSQVLVAIHLPSPHLALHSTPGVEVVYLVLAAIAAFATLWLSLGWGDTGRLYAALLGAGLFSSVLYLRAFAVPESGPSYGPVFGLALIGAFLLFGSPESRRMPISWPALARRTQWTNLVRNPNLWGLLFLTAVAVSSLFSPWPGQSLSFLFKLALLLGLTAMLSLSIDGLRTWRYAAWGVVIIAGLLPAILSGVKLLSMAFTFGPLYALAYRWHPTELGGANLVARSVLCVVPLALALVQGPPTRLNRGLGWAVTGVSAFVLIYARSWEGLFAWLGGLALYGLLVYGAKLRSGWQRLSGQRLVRWASLGAAVLLALLGVTVAVRSAALINPYSFNGRIMHWYGALLAWRDHPWVGAGPAVETSYTPYARQVNLLLDTQTTIDDPMRVIEINGEALKTHAHSLYLEMGAGTGILGFVPFVGLLAALVLLGLRVWKRGVGLSRFWAAGCLAGLAVALLWGAMDVLVQTPPFFSYPIWGLAGLLLALNHLQEPGRATAASDRPLPFLQWGMVALAAAFSLWPAYASASYASGFEALQERRWRDARLHLSQAARLRPLDPIPQQLLAEACLGEGDTGCAASAYERVSEFKRGYSPYYAQLGWLAWLGGDLDRATSFFQKAVEVDPAEAWRDGLHANLGLAYAAQGLAAEAADSFRKTLELNPQMAAAAYWRGVQRHDGGIDVILDPVYAAGASPELEQRILGQLGAAGYSERQVSLPVPAGSPVRLDDVLDLLEDEYQLARAAGSDKAPLLLAALAEASRTAGLMDRAEQAYRNFQALEPQSAFGYRELGVALRQQAELNQARVMLEEAVETSPNDAGSRYNLALLYLDQGEWLAAKDELEAIADQALTTHFHSSLFASELHTAWARLYLEMGMPGPALKAQRRATLVHRRPSDYLQLAALQRQTDQVQRAAVQCTRAAQVLLGAWSRALSPELWDIAQCFAQTGGAAPQVTIESLARDHPLAGNVLLGHYYRARDQLPMALVAYQRASDAFPGEGGPHHFLGETYQALGQPEEAAAEYRLAARLDPLESLPLIALARLQESQGQSQAALQSYRAAVDVNPGWGPAHIALGNALLVQGDRDGAADHYQQAQIASGDLQEGLLYDFAVQLAGAQIRSSGPEYVRHGYFEIDGDAQRVLFMHPDSSARYTVEVPAGAHLAFDIAMSPEAWYQPGDGVTFAVYIEPTEQTVSNPQPIFSSYIDPKSTPTARRWHPHRIDLGAYAGQTVTVILETSAGPAGDHRYDWAGWGRPRLLKP